LRWSKLAYDIIYRMPNLRGGKAYKKSKGKSKSGDDLLNVIFIEKKEDQMVGRLIRLLGNLNAHIFCEDNKQRICKICASIKKSTRFEVGDIVLVSLRDCEVSNEELKKGVRSDRGDIIGKYHPLQFPQLKLDGVNPHLFNHIDTVSGMAAKVMDGDMQGAEALAAAANDDFFEAPGESNSEPESKNDKKKDDTGDIDIDAI